jgi:LysM repeat protein
MDGSSHTVVAGDSLWGLARKYGTTIEAIQAANGLTTTNIRTGQQLTIPGR